MTHFSPRSGLRFSVQMEGGGWEGKEWSPIGLAVIPEVSQKVEHGSGTNGRNRPKGKSADGADLLFKLACGAGFGGQMA